MSRLISLALAIVLLVSSTGCIGHAAAVPDRNTTAPVSSQLAEEPEIPYTAPAAPASSEPAPEVPEEPYVRVIDPAKPMVALTFDDGPHETYSDQILDVLEANHAVATFFEVGRNIWQYPSVLVREWTLGCEIGSHSSVHNDLTKLDLEALLNDLDSVDAACRAIGVPVPTLVRPPYGAINHTVQTSTGRSLITWNIDTEDWRSRNAQKVIDYVKSLEHLDGDVVLLHSTYESTVQAVQVLVPWLLEQGYQLVTVTELMAYYYGELPQPNTLYGYTYFFDHGRTDTPVSLPSDMPLEETAAPSQTSAA